MQWMKGTCRLALLLVCIAPFSVQAKEVPDFSTIVQQVGGAVVNVTSETEEGREDRKLVPDELRAELEHTPLMDVLRQLYGDKLEEKLSGKGPNLGTGCIISDDGYIVTNYHVVEGAKAISVLTQDRHQYKAKIIGFDPGTDLALLKIEARPLPYLAMKEGVSIRVGEWVLAIGTPFGFENSVTVGVVSAIGRNLGTDERYVSFIQTDAAVNPGNSGGPLINGNGELIGINSQIVSESGDYAGLSFAVPVSIVKHVVEELKQKGNVERGWMGIAFQDLDPNLADSFGVVKVKGALISRIFLDSPAMMSGLKVGDIIMSIDNKEIVHASDIPPIIGMLPVGSQVVMKVIRKGVESPIDLVLREYPPGGLPTARAQTDLSMESEAKKSTGIIVRSLEEYERIGLDPDQEGVLVVSVLDKPWASAGIRRGDVILAMDNDPVRDVGGFYRKLGDLKKSATLVIPVLIARQGEIQHYVAVKLVSQK